MDCTLPCRSLLDKICLFWTACFASHQYQPRHTGNSWQFCATFLCPRSLPRSYLFDPAGDHLASAIAPNIAPGPRRAVRNSSKVWPLWKFRHFKLFEIEEHRGNSSIAFSVHVGLWPNDVQCPSLCPKWPSGECQHARHWTSSHPRMPKCVRDRLDHRVTGLSCSCYDWADWADWADWMKPTIPFMMRLHR